MSATRLVEFATALGIDVSFFFQDLPRSMNSSTIPTPAAIDSELAMELASVEDERLKQLILSFVRDLVRAVGNGRRLPPQP